jgi:hypothetical protein
MLYAASRCSALHVAHRYITASAIEQIAAGVAHASGPFHLLRLRVKDVAVPRSAAPHTPIKLDHSARTNGEL